MKPGVLLGLQPRDSVKLSVGQRYRKDVRESGYPGAVATMF
jgi:hypothetical protein